MIWNRYHFNIYTYYYTVHIILHGPSVCMCVFMYGQVTESRWVNPMIFLIYIKWTVLSESRRGELTRWARGVAQERYIHVKMELYHGSTLQYDKYYLINIYIHIGYILHDNKTNWVYYVDIQSVTSYFNADFIKDVNG